MIENLRRIQRDIDYYLSKSKNDILSMSIENRLDRCRKTYEEEIEESIRYLYRRDELNVLKKLNRKINGKV